MTTNLSEVVAATISPVSEKCTPWSSKAATLPPAESAILSDILTSPSPPSFATSAVSSMSSVNIPASRAVKFFGYVVFGCPAVGRSGNRNFFQWPNTLPVAFLYTVAPDFHGRNSSSFPSEPPRFASSGSANVFNSFARVPFHFSRTSSGGVGASVNKPVRFPGCPKVEFRSNSRLYRS